MSGNTALQTDAEPIIACAVSRDVHDFEALIEDLEIELGDAWGHLNFADCAAYLAQPEARSLEFLTLAVDAADEAVLSTLIDLIQRADTLNIKVILVAKDLGPMALHQLLRQGAQEFVPYPLPSGALHDAIERLRAPVANQFELPQGMAPSGNHNGVVIPVHGLGGGTGATTLAVNLAWELANLDPDDPPRVCLMDFDLQFGAVATALDLPRREAVFELLQDTEAMDNVSFMQAMMTYNEKLFVFTAPAEILPLDIIGPADVERLLEAARTNFDYVIVDMPKTLVQWTETVLHASSVYFAPLELEMRTAQNAQRLIRALKAEELPVEKLRFILNRAPGRTDLTGRSRSKRLAESLDIDLEVQLPDGGKQVAHAADHGLPLSDSAAKNPLRKEIQKLAQSVHAHNKSAAAATGA